LQSYNPDKPTKGFAETMYPLMVRASAAQQEQQALQAPTQYQSQQIDLAKSLALYKSYRSGTVPNTAQALQPQHTQQQAMQHAPPQQQPYMQQGQQQYLQQVPPQQQQQQQQYNPQNVPLQQAVDSAPRNYLKGLPAAAQPKGFANWAPRPPSEQVRQRNAQIQQLTQYQQQAFYNQQRGIAPPQAPPMPIQVQASAGAGAGGRAQGPTLEDLMDAIPDDSSSYYERAEVLEAYQLHPPEST